MSRPTWDTSSARSDFAYRPFTFYGRTFQIFPLSLRVAYRSPATPHRIATRFRLFPFRSPLLRESLLLSTPSATKMFQFAEYRPEALYIQTPVIPLSRNRVFPFGDLRIIACLQLPEAYRSLPRPSSPADAKAFTMRPL